MSRETIRELGEQRLQSLKSAGAALQQWRTYLLQYQPRAEHPDDAYAWLSCTLALAGVATDNFGVGAILVDETEQVVALGHNQVFHPHFRSDRHAEMVVMEGWEDEHPDLAGKGDLTLYTSLEPCPMCLVRLCNAAVRKVIFTAPDSVGGMVGRMGSLPPAWLELAQSKTFSPARCSQDLAHAAAQLFQLNLEELNARLGVR